MADSRDGDPVKSRRLRRKKWIRPDLQLKVVMAALLVAELTLLVNFQMSVVLLASSGASESAIGVVTNATIIAFILAVPLSILLGTYLSFKFCGPIFAIGRYLAKLVDGRWDERFNLRKGDDLQDVKGALDAVLDVMTDRVKKDRALLEESRRVLERYADAAEVRGLVQTLLDEEAEFSKRLGERKNEDDAVDPRSEPVGDRVERDPAEEVLS